MLRYLVLKKNIYSMNQIHCHEIFNEQHFDDNVYTVNDKCFDVFRHTKCIQKLLECKANINIHNNEGMTAVSSYYYLYYYYHLSPCIIVSFVINYYWF